MVAKIISLFGVTSLRHVEILAIFYGLQLALEQDFLCLELESDALPIINEIMDGEENPEDDGHLLDEIKMLMRQFNRLYCSYIPRDCNKVAHELARFAARHYKILYLV